jgi:predicted lipid carrier protein YhbT
MGTVEGRSLEHTLAEFARRVNEDPRLRQMIQDWDRTIRCVAADTGREAWLEVRQAAVRVAPAVPAEEDVRLEGDESLLLGMFAGETSPTEPYLDGRLRVTGSQEDVLRLDILSLMIWGD